MKKKPPAKKKTPRRRARLPGDRPANARIERMLRVDHAGEFGAQRIYAGQLAVLGQGKAGPVLRHMAEQEERHLAAFEKLIIERRARPTALHPLWHVAGYALGAATAALGEKAAMACTVAVEEVIDEHYQKQLDALGKDEPVLRKLIKKFRDEEIEHKHIGLDHGAEDLPYYPLLRALVRAGSKTAIWLSERI
ncbi:MAG: demethoxyubiquinone hydroxylase family protein [Alphaproteobacteria bacterium]|nr:demethoxyubiquinone hydroxylase family protein [Alphaproteobacteria bacterium]